MIFLGREFENRLFSSFLEENNIKQIFSLNDNKAAYAERFNRSFQLIMNKYMTHNNKKRYIDKLEDFTSSYNNRIHRSIQMTPNEAELERNQKLLFSRAIRKIHKFENKHRKRRDKFKINDLVRLKKVKTKFERSYKQGWTDEIFRIIDINTRQPIHTYVVESTDPENRETIEGTFYDYELSKVGESMDTSSSDNE